MGIQRHYSTFIREIILKFNADFANWDISADRDYIEASSALVHATYPEGSTLVVDLFAWERVSIPLEALHTGIKPSQN